MFNKDSKMLSRRTLLLGAAAAAGSTLVRPAYANEPLEVIVNKSVRDSPSGSDLAAIFTTRKQDWGGGKRIVPFNYPAKHEVRVAFDKKVLEMDPDDVASYWIDRRIRGGNAPPKQVNNGQLILRLVEKMDGAIGYIPKSMVDGTVRVVREL